ncbi:MAG: cytochrome c biogenesis protein CcdA [Verrucomicrobiales bacterium]|jgi:cytochrome c biogenesis protein CcdA
MAGWSFERNLAAAQNGWELSEAVLPENPESPSPGVPLTAPAFLEALKLIGSGQANRRRDFFKGAALFIIGAHLIATILASVALGFKGDWVKWLLVIEALILGIGLISHWWIHKGQTANRWAIARVAAEVARSVKSLKDHHVYLGYLFTLPFPTVLAPLLRTVNILHLAYSRNSKSSWTNCRNLYLKDRLNDSQKGQIAYYSAALAKGKRRHLTANVVFYTCSILAIVFTASKFLLLNGCLHVPEGGAWIKTLLGILAIVFPVLAVGVLSLAALAASSDLEARVHTYEDIDKYLREVHPHIASASTSAEFTRLALDTEARLLGETATWAARRSFTSVT